MKPSIAHPRAIHLAAIATLAAFLIAAAPAGKTPPARTPPSPRTPEAILLFGTRQVTHRITGLFSRDREGDLREVLKQLPEIQLVSVDFERGEGVFSYDPTKAFPGTKADKIVERFNQVLGGACRNTFGIAQRIETPPDKLTRVEIAVAGLDCKACSLAAYEIVAKVDGVAQATASFKEGKVTALIDPEKTAKDQLEAALKAKNVAVIVKN